MRKTAPALSSVANGSRAPAPAGAGGRSVTPWAWSCLLLSVLLGTYLAAALDGHHPLTSQILRGPHMDTLTRLGARVPELVAAGEFHRLVMALFLHTGPAHLLGNIVWLLGLGVLIQRWLSGPSMLAFALCCGIGGQLAGFLFVDAPSVGASPMVYGLAVGIARLSLRHRERLPLRLQRHLPLLVIVGGMVMVTSPLFAPRVDHICHLGGALTGWMLVGRTHVPSVWARRCLVLSALLLLTASAQALWPQPTSSPHASGALERTPDGLVRPTSGVPGRLTWAGCSPMNADLETPSIDCQTDGASWVVTAGRLDHLLAAQPMLAHLVPPTGRCVATLHDRDEVLWWIRPNEVQVIVLATTRDGWERQQPLREALSAGRCPRR